MIELIILFLLVVLLFAIFGFYRFLAWVFSSPDKTNPDREPSLKQDVRAAARLLQYLRTNGDIRESVYHELQRFLDQKFSWQSSVHTEDPPAITQPEEQRTTDSPVEEDFAAPAQPVDEIISSDEVIVIAEAIATPSTSEPASSDQPPVPTSNPVAPAPWDLPDPPPPTPRRSFGELMSGFMQEKNMRWGELASGILIVLSAVGLIVSLQEELRNTIPYFSALLFMLITAAIHGAGIYTLKKWKLRNTSRGTLVIGLLLIPLNFVAACVLSGGEERRALTDPWLWAAIGLGLTCFSAMTWWSSKHLFRRGHWPLVLAIMGCGTGTLLINRLVETTGSSLGYLGYALPVMGSFLIGTCLIDPRQWVRRRWAQRTTNRIYMFLGIASFAVVAALSLVVLRAESKAIGLVAVTPIASVLFLVVTWQASIIKRGASDPQRRFVAQTLEVLGLIMSAIVLIGSLSNPTVFVINALISALGLIAMGVHQSNSRLFPFGWGALAAGALASLNLVNGNFEWDQWTSATRIQQSILNGKSGLCLLAVGVCVGLIQTSLCKRMVAAEDRRSLVTQGWIVAAAIFLVGCLISVVASFLDRQNEFDVMTASALLMLAAVAALTACVIVKRRQIQALVQLPHVASVLVVAGLSHSLLWNPTLATKFQSMVGDINAGWIAVLSVHGFLMAAMATYLVGFGSRPNSNQNGSPKSDLADPGQPPSLSLTNRLGDFFQLWALVSTAVVGLAAFSLVPFQTGWGALFMAVASVCWFLIGRNWARMRELEKSEVAAIGFVVSSGLLVVISIAELGSRLAWCPTYNFPEHWLIQVVALSGWSIAWHAVTITLTRTSRMRWLASVGPRVIQWVDAALLFVVGAIVCDQLGRGTLRELISGRDFPSPLSLHGEQGWVFAAIAAVGLATVVSILEKPSLLKGAAFVIVWSLAWAAGAERFDGSRSVGSALRWILPIGGGLAAGMMAIRRPLIPVWVAMRSGLRIPGRSCWRPATTQQLINLSLAIVAGVVILISTSTVSQVLLNGAHLLGGPLKGSWFRQIPGEISFGLPVAMVVATFLGYAISERRPWLATLGSTVLQYVVVLAVVLLFLSPHPKLASSWFVNILQAVSLGMTAYGFVWLWTRARIESAGRGRDAIKTEVGLAGIARRRWLSQIEVHTLINGLLVTSLAVMAMGRFYFVPDQPGGWISSIGSLLGVIAWALFGVLAYCIWREPLSKRHSAVTWLWLVGWMGLILVGLVAAVVDRNFEGADQFVAWLPFRVVAIGAVIVCAVQAVAIWVLHAEGTQKRNTLDSSLQSIRNSSTFGLTWPVLLTGAVAMIFAIRGALYHGGGFWLYFALLSVLVGIATAVGMKLRNLGMGLVAAAITIVTVTILVWEDPQSWFVDGQPYWFNLLAITLGCLSLAWTGFYLVRRRSYHESIERSFLWLPNCVVLAGSIWMMFAALVQLPSSAGVLGGYSAIANSLGWTAWLAIASLAVVSIWNDRARFRIVSWCLLSLSLTVGCLAWAAGSHDWRFVGVNLGAAALAAVWGWIWLNRSHIDRLARSLGATRTVALGRSAARQLPIFTLILGGLSLWAALVAIVGVEGRAFRYAASAVPFALAIGVGAQSNQTVRRWLQLVSLSLVTIGILFLAWADLDPQRLLELPLLRLLVRSLVVLAAAMFVYGGLVTRWIRPGDSWLKSLREMSMATCGLAIGSFVLLLFAESTTFQPDVGCGVGMVEAAAVAVLVIGMIIGLITIAVRPENDPFALSLSGRMGYVYAAQLVAAALVAHLYFSMPFLFQLGIKEYWPYIAMAICFGGVGVAQVLQKRNLTVLGKPLFHTAAILPVLVAAGALASDSKADPSIVMLTIGMTYLLISYTERSVLSGAAAVLFGNAALWIFFNRFQGFAFMDHPQLWLIPPAVSALIAAQLSRKSLTPQQLATIRYVCVAVIYVSSTSEIFITGMGERLWPPIILAVLAVAGIMLGIMLQVKSYLYFGSLFLLMAMITMVAHAQQRLHHVWPWWAFGIGLGIAILVMFGLFEKRKNKMKALAFRMKEWES